MINYLFIWLISDSEESVEIYVKIARRNRQRMLKSRRKDSEKNRFNTLKRLERCCDLKSALTSPSA